ncbi:hypothetical protein [Desulfonema magnum]|uniref:Uncharacterized protein n=1 Tax=Desulfonema magnum TaxID=45655 RepID=A0A975BEV8_9BACT|nr:hypothetical protein [Desulfonema magnum]QTA84439.1 Uncharacterized protein dnm_004350 [Desulfonema magnum]
MPTTPQKHSPYNILASPPETVLILLAQGLERQYDALKNNRSVVRQKQTDLDANLISALPRLSALYMCEGKEDKAASVHKLMEMATTPLKEWGIDYFAKADFPYQDVILIDPQTLAPTPESFELAAKSRRTRGGSEVAPDTIKSLQPSAPASKRGCAFRHNRCGTASFYLSCHLIYRCYLIFSQKLVHGPYLLPGRSGNNPVPVGYLIPYIQQFICRISPVISG